MRGGLIILSGTVTDAGEVTNLHVLKSAHPDLNAAALAATASAWYKPAIINGKAVAVNLLWTHRIEVR